MTSSSRVCGRREGGIRISKDRKSTRLNSSHVEVSYGVFCLKKKNALLRALQDEAKVRDGLGRNPNRVCTRKRCRIRRRIAALMVAGSVHAAGRGAPHLPAEV